MVRGEEEFDRLLIAIEAFDILGDDKYATLDAKMVHRDEITTRLREIFLQRSSDDWLRLLKEEHALNVERVVTFEEVQNDPHLPLNNMISRPVEDVGIDYIINDPVNVEGVKKVGARHAPGHGEHSTEVLIEMGYGEAEIRSMKEQGVI